MRVRPALRLGGGRREERAAVEDGGRNRAVGAGRAGREIIKGGGKFYFPRSDYLYFSFISVN